MKSLLFIFIMITIFSGSLTAQINKTERDLIIDSLCSKLVKYYIYPENAEKAIQFIRRKQETKNYDTIFDEQTFAAQITSDLRQAGNDEHLRLEYSEDVISDQNENPFMLTDEEVEEVRQFVIQENFGIRKIDILKGNIGFIDFSGIFGADQAGEKYAAIMDYLSHTDALIIDLRSCRGAMGSDGISFLASYFFEKSVHLNDLVWKKDNRTEQKWTYAYIPGKRYLNKPVYILTSARTFSGGEGLAYHLQALKRATIIGEQTRGGANPGASIKLNDHFSAFIPNGTTVNPVTKSNWELTGVIPDKPAKANQALFHAYILAIQDCIFSENDNKKKTYLEDLLSFTKNNPPVFRMETFVLKGYEQAHEVFLTGTFNYWARKTIPMHKNGNNWIATVECEPGVTEYRFIVDEIPILDPENAQLMKGLEYTNSVRVIQ